MLDSKIDLVYLWCDSSDEVWKKKKNEALKKYCNIIEDNTSEATNECRFRNDNELKYSLRTVEKYAPWINHIYIVTDNQIPEWFNDKNPKISIIDHKEIMPQEALPCYNSNSIEHCIKNIPNLEEYFIMSNDDMFLAKEITPQDLFTSNGDIIYRHFGKLPNDHTDLFCEALKNSAKLIEKKYKKDFLYNPHHNFDGYRKSLVEKCYDEFKEDIDKTIVSHFRNSEDIQRSIYSNYALAVGSGVEKRIKKIDKDLPLIERIVRRIIKKYYKESLYLEKYDKDYNASLKKFSPKFFCINDDASCTDEDRQRFVEFIQNFVPEKSSFEK